LRIGRRRSPSDVEGTGLGLALSRKFIERTEEEVEWIVDQAKFRSTNARKEAPTRQ